MVRDMKFFPKIFSTRKTEKIQEKDVNLAIYRLATKAGFPPGNIRHSLVKLNGINLRKIANGVGATTLYAVMQDKSDNPEGREILARALGIDRRILFGEKRIDAA